mgnify:CR=1 FL=1
MASAQSQLVLELPDVATSPPRGGTQLVGVPVWFWVTNSAPAATTAEIPGLAVTLSAVPTSTRYRIGDATLTCDGAGTAYDPDRPAAGQHSDCTHTFDQNATVTVDATVDWQLTWTATNGQAGDLPTVSRTTSFTLTLEQAQAVTT